MKPDWNKGWGSGGGELGKLIKPIKKLIPKRKKKPARRK